MHLLFTKWTTRGLPLPSADSNKTYSSLQRRLLPAVSAVIIFVSMIPSWYRGHIDGARSWWAFQLGGDTAESSIVVVLNSLSCIWVVYIFGKVLFMLVIIRKVKRVAASLKKTAPLITRPEQLQAWHKCLELLHFRANEAIQRLGGAVLLVMFVALAGLCYAVHIIAVIAQYATLPEQVSALEAFWPIYAVQAQMYLVLALSWVLIGLVFGTGGAMSGMFKAMAEEINASNWSSYAAQNGVAAQARKQTFAALKLSVLSFWTGKSEVFTVGDVSYKSIIWWLMKAGSLVSFAILFDVAKSLLWKGLPAEKAPGESQSDGDSPQLVARTVAVVIFVTCLQVYFVYSTQAAVSHAAKKKALAIEHNIQLQFLRQCYNEVRCTCICYHRCLLVPQFFRDVSEQHRREQRDGQELLPILPKQRTGLTRTSSKRGQALLPHYVYAAARQWAHKKREHAQPKVPVQNPISLDSSKGSSPETSIAPSKGHEDLEKGKERAIGGGCDEQVVL
jgi:hypothetical protein